MRFYIGAPFGAAVEPVETPPLCHYVKDYQRSPFFVSLPGVTSTHRSAFFFVCRLSFSQLEVGKCAEKLAAASEQLNEVAYDVLRRRQSKVVPSLKSGPLKHR